MDNITHALAGGLLAAGAITIAQRRKRTLPDNFRTTATIVAVLTAELPDADLLYAGPALGMGKLGYLLHHRGHTHTALFALAGAVAVWLVTLAVKSDVRAGSGARLLLGLALAGTCSHLALDYTNNYGLHPFWPVVNRWYYGDAVFIVEPWLWLVSVPVLCSFYTSRTARTALVALLVLILAAAVVTGIVERDVMIALFLGGAALVAATWVTPARARIAAGCVAWMLVELVFMTASSRARQAVVAVAGTSLLDVALTPHVSNPLCFTGLVIDSDAATVRVRSATVAPFPGVRSAEGCARLAGTRLVAGMPQPAADAPNTLPVGLNSASVQWLAGEFRAPVGELASLATHNCTVNAALEFMRVPVWRVSSDGAIAMADARFGAIGTGFAALEATAAGSPCPRHVPGWTPPRADLLRVGSEP